MMNVDNVNEFIKSKDDIPLSVFDIVDNTMLDDDYNE
jgi:hypothetical protein